MSAKIDPVAIARCVVADNDEGADYYCEYEEILALAQVVIASSEVIESVPSTYDEEHPTVKRHAAALIALAAALKGA